MRISCKLFAGLLVSSFAAMQLAGCGANGGAQIPSTSPSSQQQNLAQNVLQLAVGTVNFGEDGSAGLNVVATLRQPNGLSGVLADMPTLTGPVGFTVPAGAPGAYSSTIISSGNIDAGTRHISGSPQVPLNNQGLINTTLGTFTGVFSYGFGPFNCDQNCATVSGAYYPGVPNASGGNGFTSSAYYGGAIWDGIKHTLDPTQPQPFFSSGSAANFLVGPPAAPFFNDGTFPAGFAGYSPGFTMFLVNPVAGRYNLSVNAAAQNTAPFTYNASATLHSTAPLGSISASFVGAAGGGSGTVTVPAGVTEILVFIVDIERNLYYTVRPRLNGTGSVNYTLPGNLGPCVGANCQNGPAATPSLKSRDDIFVCAIGYDYPAFEAGPPGNRLQKPTIVGANGQADMTISPFTIGLEP